MLLIYLLNYANILNQLNIYQCTKHSTFVVLLIHCYGLFIYTCCDLFIHLMGFNTVNTLLITILYFIDTLDKFNTLDTIHMGFNTLDILLGTVSMFIDTLDWLKYT